MSKNDIRISPNAIHGTKVIGMSIDKYNQAISKIERLEERVKELETELYFCNRNKRVEDLVNERTKLET